MIPLLTYVGEVLILVSLIVAVYDVGRVSWFYWLQERYGVYPSDKWLQKANALDGQSEKLKVAGGVAVGLGVVALVLGIAL